jgi:predicted peroxiredoxin
MSEYIKEIEEMGVEWWLCSRDLMIIATEVARLKKNVEKMQKEIKTILAGIPNHKYKCKE